MISKLTIKSYGVTVTLPSEILILEDCIWAKTGEHLALGKDKNIMGNDCFIVLRKNGVVISGPSPLIHSVGANSLIYQECSVEKYYKMKAFL